MESETGAGRSMAELSDATRVQLLLAARLAEWYPHHGVEAWGDPAGAARAQTDERTCLDIVREYADIPVRSAPTETG